MQLIDATERYEILRRNLGDKNREFSSQDIAWISDTFLKFDENGNSKILPNEEFGYWKVTVDRPLRIEGIEIGRKYAANDIREFKARGMRSPTAHPVIKRMHPRGTEPDPLRGAFFNDDWWA